MHPQLGHPIGTKTRFVEASGEISINRRCFLVLFHDFNISS